MALFHDTTFLDKVSFSCVTLICETSGGKNVFKGPLCGLNYSKSVLGTTLQSFISFLTGIHLRSYQVDGVRWLSQCMKNQQGCILGDEMGLGKTCQVSNGMGLSCL